MPPNSSGRGAAQRSGPAGDLRPPHADIELIVHADEALGVLQGKWKVHLLVFMARGIRRHGRLLACLPGVSKKMLTDTLRALERDGLVNRRAEVPARVEYTLTPLGWTITEPLIALADWGQTHADQVGEARLRYRRSSAVQAPPQQTAA